jgi:hypothetical protein
MIFLLFFTFNNLSALFLRSIHQQKMIPTERQQFILRKGQEWHPFLRMVCFGFFLKFKRKKDIADGLTAPFFMFGLNEAHLLIKMEGLRPDYKLD